MNKKMELLKKAEKVNHVFDKMDKETQEAVKSLINHLMVAKTKKDNRIEHFINTVLIKNYAKILENDLYDFDCQYNSQNKKIKKAIYDKYKKHMDKNENV